MQAYMEIEQAMERYSLLLEEHVATLRKSEEPKDQAKFERMLSGSSAMRDSCQIFLSYAKFVAYGMPDSDDLIEDEDLQT
jgi:hypothetical protein